MPNVTAAPVSERDDYEFQQRTYFIGLAGTVSVTYTYPIMQDSLTIKNRSDTDSITATINGVGYTIAKGNIQKITASFTSFDITATANSQSFDATAIKSIGTYDLASKVFKPMLGSRFKISNTDWASQSVGNQWTASGSPSPATISFNANAVRLDGTATNIAGFWYYNNFRTASKRAKIKITYKMISAVGASTNGAIFGLSPVGNSWYPSGAAIQFQINCNSGDINYNKICIYQGYNQGVSVTSSTNLPTPALNDVFELTIKLEHTAVHVIARNVTQDAVISLVHRWDSRTTDPVNMWNFSMTVFGGTWDVLSTDMQDDELVGNDLLFVGDSISSGVLGGKTAKTGRDFPTIVASRFPRYDISRFAGPGDGLLHYSQTTVINEITARKPKNALVLLGTNDFGLGSRTLPQVQTDYQTLITGLKNSGINVIHAGLLPRNSYDVRPFNAWVRSTYPNDYHLPLFGALAAPGVCPITSGGASYGINSTYCDDGVHPNDVGAFLIADLVTMFLIENGIFNPNLMMTNVLSDMKGPNVTVTTAATTLAVTLPYALPDTSYAVQVGPNWNTTYWITAKTVTGFTINFGTAAPAGATADWFVTR